MKVIKIKYLLIVLFVIFLLPQHAKSQMFETRSGVDTLKWSERLSLHTNIVNWTLLVPNIGVEFDIRNTNWNRWAVGVNVQSRWKTTSTFNQPHFYHVQEARVYFRNYWRTRQIDESTGVKAHTNFFDRLFSCRRRAVKHPQTTYYRGFYASVTDFSYKIKGWHGRQGKALSAGVTYGILRPLYTFTSGNSLNLDFGVDVGMVMSNVDRFHMEGDDCYVLDRPGKWKITPYPLPTEARVGLVYRFGKYPISKKYRWRYDVDLAYQESLISAEAERKRRADSVATARETYNTIYNDFIEKYDSIAKINAKAAELNKIEMAKRKAALDAQKAEAQAKAKADKAAAAAAAKEEKAKAKAKKDDETPAAPSVDNQQATSAPSTDGTEVAPADDSNAADAEPQQENAAPQQESTDPQPESASSEQNVNDNQPEANVNEPEEGKETK